MALRITSVDEYQFLTCLKHGVWGSKSDRFKKWDIGDELVFAVDKRIAALAVISGKGFKSDEKIWDNGVYPYRIEIEFKVILEEENRLPLLGEIRDALIKGWGNTYGYGILNQLILPQAEADIIRKEIYKQDNGIKAYIDNLEELCKEAKLKRDASNQKISKEQSSKKITKKAVNDSSKKAVVKDIETKDENENETEVEISIHSEAQSLLIELGLITGCAVGIATNDKGKVYKGRLLSENCLEKLPNFGFNKEASDQIALIDVIWTKQNNPLCAFEVEATTSVYSGLLRMSDLIALIPSIKIKLYIVAEERRKNKVMKELRRPTFNKIGINEYCKFISIEDLKELVSKVKGLAGYIKPDIIDTIAYDAE